MNNNKLQFTFFLIITFSLIYLLSLRYNKTTQLNFFAPSQNKLVTQNNAEPDTKVASIALFSDSHLNSEIFPKLKSQLSDLSPLLALHAGDLTNFGTINEMQEAKNEMSSLNIGYIAIPGDHDIAATSSDSNFKAFFSYPTNLILNVDNIKILLLPNFYNFTTLPTSQFNTIKENIDSSDIIFSSQPIYVPSDNMFSDKYMGSFTSFDNLSDLQKSQLNLYADQRNQILSLIRKTIKPKIIISGDHHRSSSFSDPYNSLVSYHILGSLSKYIYFGKTQLLQTSLQSNRFSILDVFKSNEPKTFRFNIREIEIK